MPSLPTANPLAIVENRLGFSMRLLLLSVGLVAVVVPAWELRHAFSEIGWWTLACGLFIAIAWGVGASFLACAVTDASLSWTLDDRTLFVEQRSMLRRRLLAITRFDIASTQITALNWTDGPETFCLNIHLRSGETLRSSALESYSAARGLETTLKRRMGLW